MTLRVISGVMQTKLLAVALLEAATENARGALITPQVTSRSAGPATKSSARTVEAILARGKDATAEFDMRQSPLSYRIAATMSPMQIRELSAEIDPASPLDGRWLARLPNELTSQAKTLALSMFAA